nr:MAG TPA: hypothetical protein [Caudoviricetes sp.]
MCIKPVLNECYLLIFYPMRGLNKLTIIKNNRR